MPNFRRGREAIEKAAQKAKSGNFRAFTPNIFWNEDGQERFLLFLNPIEEIPEVELISFIPVKGKKANDEEFTYFEQTIARTDSCLDDPRKRDPLVEDWDATPRVSNVAVAVELEPVFVAGKGGRKRPKGFEVKTQSFERRVKDEDGELTDEKEEVTAPAVGFVTQSPANFFNILSSYDASEAPIEETAVKITRIGKSSNTVYTVDGYPDQEIDLSNLIDNIEGISYLDNPDEVAEALADADEQEVVLQIGGLLLDKRLEELADEDRYDELYEGVDESLDKFGSKKKDKAKKEKPARSQRRKTEEPEEGSEDDNSEEEETPKKRTRKSSRSSSSAKLDELRQRAKRQS